MVKKTEISIKKEIEHIDLLGQEVKVGSIVATHRDYGGKKLVIARVTELHPKLISLNLIGTNWQFRMYPHDTLVIDGNEHLTLYLLQRDRIKK